LIDKPDKMTLMESAAFRRFLFDLIVRGGVFDASATAGDGRGLYLEGRRSLALEVLRDMEEAAPAPSPSGLPIWASIQTLREEAQSPPTKAEKTVGGRNDHYRDLRDGDE
jgi:hypothetical protein